MNIILFLDIDGVLNSVRSAIAFHQVPRISHGREGLKYFDMVALNMIRNLCNEHDLKVVISSTWRMGSVTSDFDFLELPIIGLTTTDNLGDGRRGFQIDQWLREHHEGIDGYLIIDDDSDMLIGQMDHFVKVNHNNGFSYENYQKCEDIINLIKEQKNDD